MSDGFKSFDELYKAIIGNELPEKTQTLDAQKKAKPHLESKTKLEKVKQKHQINNNNRPAASMKKKEERDAENLRRIKLQQEQSVQRKKAEKAEKEKQLFISSLKKLPSPIKCPAHGNLLQMGCYASFSEDSGKAVLYFCAKCKSFYYKSDEPKSNRKLFVRGFPVKNIKQSEKKVEHNTKTIEQTFDECCEKNDIVVLKTGEPSVTKCLSCGRYLLDLNEKDALVAQLSDGDTRNIAGAFCNMCGIISISSDRISSLARFCNSKHINIDSVTTKHRSTMSNERYNEAKRRFNPTSTTLYIHQGTIRCLAQNHNVISVTLEIPSCIRKDYVVINANYCFDCDRFFLSADEYEYYRSVYPIMLIRFEYMSGDGADHNLADKSPLMLAGYSVRANLKYSDYQRQNILKNVIELGILRKHEVINYLNYFIAMNGKARGMEAAVEKWKRDLEYVRTHNFDKQRKWRINDIRRW